MIIRRTTIKALNIGTAIDIYNPVHISILGSAGASLISVELQCKALRHKPTEIVISKSLFQRNNNPASSANVELPTKRLQCESPTSWNKRPTALWTWFVCILQE